MRKEKKNLISIKYELNSFDEIIEHIVNTSITEINLDECQINIPFDLRIVLKELKKRPSFSAAIEIENRINDFGYKVFYCILKLPCRGETTIFKHGAFFELVEFIEYVNFIGAVFESDYSFKKSTFHNKAIFSTIDFEVDKQQRLDQSFFQTTFKKKVSFFDTYFNSLASFRLSSFYEDIDIGGAKFTNIDLSEVEMKDNVRLLKFQSVTIEEVANQETGLLLKQYALRHNDSVSMLKFKMMEMNAYEKSLMSKLFCKKSTILKTLFEIVITFGDISILKLNKLSNSHGNNFLKGILFTLAVWTIFFSWFVMKRDGIGSSFIWAKSAYIKEAIDFLWLFSGIKELGLIENLNWGLVIPYISGKIFIAYGIYQTIAAFRKYIK